ncbi:Uncharacterised protein [Yersinia aldovae]|uniref:hypothetical protein n=1 Tax=Yersinia aldovae TaxID=29483 RepID=UPI0005E78FAD|nr:hypothetical protein [Yersinia aldovae]CNK32776.1 Uncharacterised protein [Yersinia aldovae]
MKISKLATERLLNINWLSDLGNKISVSDVILAMSLNEAENYLSDPEWENVTLEKSNEISGYLATKHTAIFQDWNDVAKEAKLFFTNDIKPKIPHLNDFDNTLLHQCIEWDVIHYLIEYFYSEKLKAPLFFNKLVSIYESGHIPCGWVGNWPKGQLVIY